MGTKKLGLKNQAELLITVMISNPYALNHRDISLGSQH